MSFPFTTYLLETQLAIKAALAAGKVIKNRYQRAFKVDFKAGQEPVTEADHESNEEILHHLRQMSYPTLSEESTDGKRRLRAQKCWIVDPLDGTTDFIQKSDEFTVMIALVEGHQPVLGVINCPALNRLYVAIKDEGAYEQDGSGWKRLRVTNVDELKIARAVGSRNHLTEQEQLFISSLQLTNFQQVGSSLKVTQISKGNAEFYFTETTYMKQWDTAAAYCIIHEAGGKMTDLEGEKLIYNTENVHHLNGILVSNGKIHDTVLEKYNSFRKNQKKHV